MFHLLRVLYKDYLFYLVQKRLATVSSRPLICMFLDYFPPPQHSPVKFERQLSNPNTYEQHGQHSQAMHPPNETTYVLVDQNKYSEMNQVNISIKSLNIGVFRKWRCAQTLITYCCQTIKNHSKTQLLVSQSSPLFT